jgi:hypothetical protein
MLYEKEGRDRRSPGGARRPPAKPDRPRQRAYYTDANGVAPRPWSCRVQSESIDLYSPKPALDAAAARRWRLQPKRRPKFSAARSQARPRSRRPVRTRRRFSFLDLFDCVAELTSRRTASPIPRRRPSHPRAGSAQPRRALHRESSPAASLLTLSSTTRRSERARRLHVGSPSPRPRRSSARSASRLPASSAPSAGSSIATPPARASRRKGADSSSEPQQRSLPASRSSRPGRTKNAQLTVQGQTYEIDDVEDDSVAYTLKLRNPVD